MSWRDTLPHRDRCGAHAPAPLRADDARDPDRHHRGDPHGRARPRRQGRRAGPDQRARHEHPRRLAGQLDRTAAACAAASARRRRSPCRTPTRSRRATATPDVQAVAATATTPGVADHRRRPTGRPRSPARHRRGSRSGRGTVTNGRFIDAADEKQAAMVVVLGPDTASELFANRDPVGQDSRLQRHDARGSSACSRR